MMEQAQRTVSLVEPPPRAASLVEEQLLLQAFARVRVGAFGLSLGVVSGVALFLATFVLVLRHRPEAPLGPHLGLLSQYFPGYSVSVAGSVVGLFYGFLSGFVLGVLMALLLNISHLAYLQLMARRIRRAAIFQRL